MKIAHSNLLVKLLFVSIGSALWAQDFDKGLDAYERGNATIAAKELRPHAEQGDVRAQAILGQLYMNGYGVEKNYAEALPWLRLAAEKSHPQAQFDLGQMYSGGHGVSMDRAEASRWILLSAEQGHAHAQFSIGGRFCVGQGVPKNEAECVKWVRLAAEQGLPNAQRRLGDLYARGAYVGKDEVAALGWWGLLALQSDKPRSPYFKLGLVYEIEPPRDLVRAYMLYALSRANGYEYAGERMALITGKMTAAEISQANEMATQCLLSNYTNCDWQKTP